MSKKLVEREHLLHVFNELIEIRSAAPQVSDRIDTLLAYMEQNVIKSDQEEKNQFKRVIYKRMKEASTPEENKQWYDFYKSLDGMFG